MAAKWMGELRPEPSVLSTDVLRQPIQVAEFGKTVDDLFISTYMHVSN